MLKHQVKDHDGGHAVLYLNQILAIFYGKDSYTQACKHRNRLIRAGLEKKVPVK